MKLISKSMRTLAAVGVLAGISVAAVPTKASAVTVPFQDEYQKGTLTFCNQKNQPVTSGSLDTVPFVWKAISSAPAPSKYTRAYLAVYQPLPYEDPSDWSGYQLTVEALFSNAKNPAAQATYLDQPLLWADQEYPPHLNGLYEVRMYFTQPLMTAYTTTYPAAVIQVTGNTWSLVSGGGTSCSAGSAVSIETYRFPKSETETPHVLSPNGKNLVLAGSSGTSSSDAGKSGGSPTTTRPTSKSGASSGTSVPPTTSGSSVVAAGRSSGGGGGGSSAGIITGVAIAVIAVGGGGAWWLRRRRHPAGDGPAALP